MPLRLSTPRLVEKNGYWNLVFYARETRRRRWHSLGTQSRQTAERRARAMTRAWEDGTFDPFRERFEFEAYTVERAAERYLEDHEGHLKPKTLRNMRGVLNLLIEATPSISVQHVEPRHIKRVIARPPSPHSRLSYYRQLRVFFRWCISAGLMSEDPTEHLPRPRAPKKNPAFLSRSEFARLVAYMEEQGDQRMADIVRWAVSTGGRLGEICQLQFGDVDLDSGLVHYRATGGRTNKSNRDRAVPLVPMARAVYLRQLRRYPSPRVPRDAPHFTGVKGGAIRDGGSFTSHRFKRYVRALAALDPSFSEEYDFHTLRHTFASWLRLAGVPLDRIQYWLGHRSITTTEVYAHIIPEHIQHESAGVFPDEEPRASLPCPIPESGRLEQEHALRVGIVLDSDF